MTQEQLNEVLKQHKVWLDSDGKEGKRAVLRYTDLTCVDLTGSDLTGADLTGADLSGLNLRYTNLSDVDLTGAVLRNADLRFADLTEANLIDIDLTDTGIHLFEGPDYQAIYNSKDDKLYIGCQVHTLDHWLENYINIGKKHGYSDEEIEVYGTWFKKLKGNVK